jgi:hypothetical protein
MQGFGHQPGRTRNQQPDDSDGGEIGGSAESVPAKVVVRREQLMAGVKD